MHLSCIPRHRLELSLADYAGIARDLIASPSNSAALESFERRFASFLGCKHAIAVPSGRFGLRLTLDRLNLSPGDEAILPAFNLSAVIEEFSRLGVVPRLCDVSPSDLNIDASQVEPLITERTRVLLATHMFGHAADLDALSNIADRNNILLLEDCAHAMGTQWRGRCVGTFGRASIFSFSVLKLITTFGGGMIATNDDDLAQGIREDLAWRSRPCGRWLALKRAGVGTGLDLATRRTMFSVATWPALRLVRSVAPGFQKRMLTETPRRAADARSQSPSTFSELHPFQVRLGERQLAKGPSLIAQRRRIDGWLNAALHGIPGVRCLEPHAHSRSNGLYYGLLADRPQELSAYLFRHGVDTETSEYRNCADLEWYRPTSEHCPGARQVESRIIRLPNHPGLSIADVARIGRLIARFYATGPVGRVLGTRTKLAVERERVLTRLNAPAFSQPGFGTTPTASGADVQAHGSTDPGVQKESVRSSASIQSRTLPVEAPESNAAAK